MKRNFVILILLFLLACSEQSKRDLLFGHTIAPKLYVRTYKNFGSGALGGDLVTDYLTDSTNFSYKVDVYDNAVNRFRYSLNGDTIVIDKYIVEPQLKQVKKIQLSLKKLIAKHKFE